MAQGLVESIAYCITCPLPRKTGHCRRWAGSSFCSRSCDGLRSHQIHQDSGERDGSSTPRWEMGISCCFENLFLARPQVCFRDKRTKSKILWSLETGLRTPSTRVTRNVRNCLLSKELMCGCFLADLQSLAELGAPQDTGLDEMRDDMMNSGRKKIGKVACLKISLEAKVPRDHAQCSDSNCQSEFHRRRCRHGYPSKSHRCNFSANQPIRAVCIFRHEKL